MKIVRALLLQVQQSQLFNAASSLAYTTILSIIPTIAISFAIFRTLGGMNHLYAKLEPLILNNLAEGTGSDVVSKLHGFINNAHTSVIGVGGLIGLVFTTTTLFANVEKTINRIWETPLKRKFLIRYLFYGLIIVLGPVALAIAVGLASSKNLPLNRYLPSGTGAFALGLVLFFGIFKYIPNCPVRPRYAVFSALLTSIFWWLTRLAYVFYTKKIMSYGKIYGSLAAVPILLLWIYIAWIIILLGAALTAVLQRRFEDQGKIRSHHGRKPGPLFRT